MTVEADLCKALNISWADARDLASYARGKLNIIPGDTMAEQIHRQSIFTTAMEADKQFPRTRKRNIPNTNRGELEQNKQILNNPEQHNTPDRQELVMAVQDVTMDRGNAKVANEAAKVDGTTKTKTDQSGLLGCLACLQCLETLGHCFALFSFC